MIASMEDLEVSPSSGSEAALSFSFSARELFKPDSTPAAITLRAGVFIAPPFANISGNDYIGYEIEMLDKLREIANEEDGVDLVFEMSPIDNQTYTDAFNLVASDCNTTANPLPREECNEFDLVVGDFYATPERGGRARLTPTWLHSCAMPLVRDGDGDLRLKEADGEGAPVSVCLPEGSFIGNVTRDKFPKANHLDCRSTEKCREMLAGEHCDLYVDDSLFFANLQDKRFELIPQQVTCNYYVWPMKSGLDPNVTSLLDKWIYEFVSSGSSEKLYNEYFFCSSGTTGQHCEFTCDPKLGLSDPLKKECICHSNNRYGNECRQLIPEDQNLYPLWEVAMAYVYFAINASVCIFCIVWLHQNRKRPQVEVWQPFFLRLVLLGCLMSSSSILAIVQESDNEKDGPDLACAVFPWLFALGFSITFGTLFAKILRVYRLFKAAATARRITVTNADGLKIIGAILSVDVIICTVWTAVDRLHWTRVETVDERDETVTLSSVGYCTSDSWEVFVTIIAVWHLVLMLVACCLCYMSRNVPSEFSEGRMLAVAVLSNLQIAVISIPILILVGADSTAQLFIRSTLIWLNDFTVVALIFGKLIHSVQTHLDASVNIARAVNEFTRRENKGNQRHPTPIKGRVLQRQRSMSW